MGSYPGKKCQSGIVTVIMDVFIVLRFLFWSRRAVCLNLSVAPERMFLLQMPRDDQVTLCLPLCRSWPWPQFELCPLVKEVAERMIYFAVKMG